MEKLKVLELFAGIGACSKALTNLGIEHEIVDAVEIDKCAIDSFNAIHGTNFEPQDITKWDKDIECDLIMHGSPCQDFSAAGLQAGGDEGSGTRSSLMYETLRIVDKIKPRYVIWENVKNLLSKKHKHNFEEYLLKMEWMGYKNSYKVLNAKDFGIPQNRERVFTISVLDDEPFVFPEEQVDLTPLSELLFAQVDPKYIITNSGTELQKRVITEALRKALVKPYDTLEYTYSNARLSELEQDKVRIQNKKDNQILPTLKTKCEQYGVCVGAYRGRGTKGNYKQNLEIRKDNLSNTLTGVKSDNVVVKDFTVRKLTPNECWRLMGFSDEDYTKASLVCKESQLYKQAGNSIVVPVLQSILKALLNK